MNMSNERSLRTGLIAWLAVTKLIVVVLILRALGSCDGTSERPVDAVHVAKAND